MLFDRVRSTARFQAVTQAEAREIDELNILQATLRSMGRAVRQALEGSDFKPLVLVDGNTPIPDLANQRTLVKGDGRSYHIAAASILAKVTRDRIMERYHRRWPQYGFDTNKGYPTKSHRRSVLETGRSPAHRYSFRVSDPALDGVEAE